MNCEIETRTQIIESWKNGTFPFFVMEHFDHTKASLQQIVVIYDLLILFGVDLNKEVMSQTDEFSRRIVKFEKIDKLAIAIARAKP